VAAKITLLAAINHPRPMKELSFQKTFLRLFSRRSEGQDMTTLRKQIRKLLEKIMAVYSAERVVTFLMSDLNSESYDFRLRYDLLREAQENQRHCERLEELINTARTTLDNDPIESELTNVMKQIFESLVSYTRKHLSIGYDTSLLVAEVTGRDDIVEALKTSIEMEREVDLHLAKEQVFEIVH
jgi:hypothetical protein